MCVSVILAPAQLWLVSVVGAVYLSLVVHTYRGHEDEVLDVTFDYTGQNVATASADGTAKLFSTVTQQCIVKLEGHSGEVSKVSVDAT